MKTNEDIDMQKHRIKGLGNPLEIDDAVMLQYVASRIEGLTAEIEKLWEARSFSISVDELKKKKLREGRSFSIAVAGRI